MNGPELAKRFRAIRPETKILFMSGYTDNVISYTAALEPGTAFLQKPFTPQTLTHKVHEVLERGPRAKQHRTSCIGEKQYPKGTQMANILAVDDDGVIRELLHVM